MAANNPWAQNMPFGPTMLPYGVVTITTSDVNELSDIVRQITCTGDGNINVVWIDGSTSVEAITTTKPLKGFIKQVKSTSTTATGLKGYK